MKDVPSVENARQVWLGVLAKAPEGRIPELLERLAPLPAFDWLRKPEIGSVMVRGKTGGTGAAFNLGEMTVTRCSLRLETGEVGHGYVQGRRKADAEAAALADALLQTALGPEVHAQVIDPISADLAAEKETRARKAAATKVDFFTMVRGED